MSEKPPIFIVGPPRSGTSLFRTIINNHPDIWITQETHFFEEIYPLRTELKLQNKKDLEDLSKRIARRFDINQRHDEESRPFTFEEISQSFQKSPPKSWSEVFKRMLKLAAEKRNRSRLGEKTPRHLFHLDEILNWYSSAKVIVMIRDGRDYMNSYLNYQQRDIGPQEQKRLYALSHPFIVSLLWRSSASEVFQWKDTDFIRVIRYEDLVETPEKVIPRACEFLEINYREEMLNVTFSNSSFDTSQQGISSESVNRWQDELDPGDIHVFETINGSFLEDFGYDLSQTSDLVSLIQKFATFPFYAAYALYLNRDRTENLYKYLYDRVTSILLSTK